MSCKAASTRHIWSTAIPGTITSILLSPLHNFSPSPPLAEEQVLIGLKKLRLDEPQARQ
jgi:hypothetical protein